MSVVSSAALHWDAYVLAWYSEWNIPRIQRCHFAIDCYFYGPCVRNSEDFLSWRCYCKLPNSVPCWTVRRRHAVKCSTLKLTPFEACVYLLQTAAEAWGLFLFSLRRLILSLAYLGCVPGSANFSQTVVTFVLEESIRCLVHNKAAVLMCYDTLCPNFVVQCLLFVCQARALIIETLLVWIISCKPIHCHWIALSSQTGLLNVPYSRISVIWCLLSVSGISFDLNIMKEIRSSYFWRLSPFREVSL